MSIVVGAARVVVGVVLARVAVDAVGVDPAGEQHEVEDGAVQHRLDDGDGPRREDGVVPADDLHVLLLARLPVGGALLFGIEVGACHVASP